MHNWWVAVRERLLLSCCSYFKPAKRFLCTPASSVPCERRFSKCGKIMSKKRNRLNPKTAEKIMYLNENLWVLPSQIIPPWACLLASVWSACLLEFWPVLDHVSAFSLRFYLSVYKLTHTTQPLWLWVHSRPCGSAVASQSFIPKAWVCAHPRTASIDFSNSTKCSNLLLPCKLGLFPICRPVIFVNCNIVFDTFIKWCFLSFQSEMVRETTSGQACELMLQQSDTSEAELRAQFSLQFFGG